MEAEGDIELYTSLEILNELEDVHFVKRFTKYNPLTPFIKGEYAKPDDFVLRCFAKRMHSLQVASSLRSSQ